MRETEIHFRVYMVTRDRHIQAEVKALISRSHSRKSPVNAR
jgi:hypothetical protein